MAAAHATTTQNRIEPAWLAGDGRPETGARLLDVDADLARVVPPVLRERLSSMLRVRVETCDAGSWTPAAVGCEPDALGLLVLDGLMLRELEVEERCGAELVGPGDVLRPWGQPSGSSVPAELAWQVADGPVRVAVLDRRASAVIRRVPAMVNEVLDRALARGRALHLQLALTQMHGIDRRLELLLWHLADRWGTVTLDGVVLPLDLTHEMLGRLIGARRPSVTTALGRLSESGAVLRCGTGWLLRRDPRSAPAL